MLNKKKGCDIIVFTMNYIEIRNTIKDRYMTRLSKGLYPVAYLLSM